MTDSESESAEPDRPSPPEVNEDALPDVPEQAISPAAGKRKKRRRGKKAKKGKKSAARAGQPAFAADYPRHPELKRLLKAFADGNYAFVRVRARKLADEEQDEAVRQAAADLARRIRPDNTAIMLWALGGGLLLFLMAFYLLQHTHG